MTNMEPGDCQESPRVTGIALIPESDDICAGANLNKDEDAESVASSSPSSPRVDLVAENYYSDRISSSQSSTSNSEARAKKRAISSSKFLATISIVAVRHISPLFPSGGKIIYNDEEKFGEDGPKVCEQEELMMTQYFLSVLEAERYLPIKKRRLSRNAV